jgi:putative ABC transport system permease protein
MTLASFVLKNALRNRRRAVLCILSVAVSLFLLVTLQVALRELTLPPTDVGAALRVLVRSKVSVANLLPARQRSVIERIPGVEAVSPFTWFGGKFRDQEHITFAQFAMDARVLTNIFTEARVAPEHLAAFLADRTACLVGRITADRYRLKVGDRISLTSIAFPCTLELKVAGFYEGTIDDRNILFHHKYLDESWDNPGWVGMWWVKVRSIQDMPRVVAAINRAFENTSAEVWAETERAFQLSFVSMWGDIRTLVRSVSSVVVFTLVLVTASTMNMAVRERLQELAMLKALGYRRSDLLAFILAESVGLALTGGLVGVGGAWLVFTHGRLASGLLAAAAGAWAVGGVWAAVRHRRWLSLALSVGVAAGLGAVARFLYLHPRIADMTDGILLTFEVTPRIVGVGMAVAVALGVVASLAPFVAVARLSVVEGLRTLD